MKVELRAAGRPGRHANPPGVLTERQNEILQLICRGERTKQIANALNISPKTVEFHRGRIMASLGAHSVAALVRVAIEEGLVAKSDPAKPGVREFAGG